MPIDKEKRRQTDKLKKHNINTQKTHTDRHADKHTVKHTAKQTNR